MRPRETVSHPVDKSSSPGLQGQPLLLYPRQRSASERKYWKTTFTLLHFRSLLQGKHGMSIVTNSTSDSPSDCPKEQGQAMLIGCGIAGAGFFVFLIGQSVLRFRFQRALQAERTKNILSSRRFMVEKKEASGETPNRASGENE